MLNKINTSSLRLIAPTLTSSQYELIKIIAILDMLICHIGIIFLPDSQIMYAIGRMAFPLFAFLMVYSYCNYTSSPLKFIVRVLIVGLFAQAPFTALFNVADTIVLNIMFTLGFGLLIIYVLDIAFDSKSAIKKYSIIYVVVAFFLAAGAFVEYIHLGLWLVVSYWAWMRFVTIPTMFFAIISTVLLNMPSGYYMVLSTMLMFAVITIVMNADVRVKRINKWIFYIFYPLHLVILHLLR